jgi:hypothetical protein
LATLFCLAYFAGAASLNAQVAKVVRWRNDAGVLVTDAFNSPEPFVTSFKGINDLSITLLKGSVQPLFTDAFNNSGNNPSYLVNFVGTPETATGDNTAGDLTFLQTDLAAPFVSLRFDFSQPLNSQDRIVFADIDNDEKYQVQAFQRAGRFYVAVKLTGWRHETFSGQTGATPDARWAIWNPADGTLTSNAKGTDVNEPLNVLTPDQNIDRVVIAKIAGAGTAGIQFLQTPALPPTIISPTNASGNIGALFIYQFEAIDATSLSVTNLPDGLTFDPKISAITGVPTTNAFTQVGLSASNASGTTNATLSLDIADSPGAGLRFIADTAAKVRVDQPFVYQVISGGGDGNTILNTGSIAPGISADPMTGKISGVTASDGSYNVGMGLSNGNQNIGGAFELTFTSDLAVPVIISPMAATLSSGQPFSYQINAPSTADPSTDPTTYTLIGKLPLGLSFDSKTGTISGNANFEIIGNPHPQKLSGGIVTNVQLFATNSHGTGTLPLVFFLPPTGTVNISTRMLVGTGEDVMIGGFIITGNAPKKVILRAIGPSLKANGKQLPGALQDPMLELHDAKSSLGSNDDWRSSQEQEIIDSTIPPSDNRESAIVATLAPGGYTAVVSGKGNTTGIGLIELYDLGTASLDTGSNAQLAEISTRGKVFSGDNVLIGGFIISGQPTKIIARAIGPELTANGISGVLSDTTLELHDSNGGVIAFNDDWRSTQEQAIKDTTVPPKDDRESAIVETLHPGAYTAIVRGKNGLTGVALVEVYSLK